MGYLWGTLVFMGFVCGVGVSLMLSGCGYWVSKYGYWEGELMFWFVFSLPYHIFLVAWLFSYYRDKDQIVFWMPFFYSIGVAGGECLGTSLFEHQYVAPSEKVVIAEILVGVQVVLCALMFFISWKRKPS